MSNQTNVAHLGSADAQARNKIKSPAVVAPELAQDSHAPIPQIDQDAQTGPEIVGAEDPTRDSVQKKPSMFERVKNKILK
ncbi:hypothetical protein MYAM1_000464 [Malassezia yamatoensis]|uniref:Uncharacterized protein n=1 Tax=Malassezia yamatoensis TaxID=253288 RepID=A0AAJ5YR84_9BASI|nr:hypothetical protein MYAM1_000464 [Malassezia yamatoensis]